MKHIKLFEQFISENKKEKEFEIFFKNAKFSVTLIFDDIWSEISYKKEAFPVYNTGTAHLTQINTKGIEKFIEYVKEGLFDEKYKVGSFEIIDLSTDPPKSAVVTTKDIKNGWNPLNDMKQTKGGADSVDTNKTKGNSIDTSNVKEISERLQKKLAKKYEKWERGLIKAWGGTLYLNYHGLKPSGKTQPLSNFKSEMESFLDLDKGSSKYEDMNEWLADGGLKNGVPLFNKKLIEKSFNTIAKKTPAPHDFMIYRAFDIEQPGINSYTLYPDDFYQKMFKKKTLASYLIPKGTPIIFAGVDADKNEILWNPTNSDLTKYRVS